MPSPATSSRDNKAKLCPPSLQLGCGLGHCPVVRRAVKVLRTRAWSCALAAEFWGFGGTHWSFNDLHRLYKYLKVCRPPDISPTDLRHGHVNAQEGGFTGPEQNAWLNTPDLSMYLQLLGLIGYLFCNFLKLLSPIRCPKGSSVIETLYSISEEHTS